MTIIREEIIKRKINYNGMAETRDESRCSNCRFFTVNPKDGFPLSGSLSAGACSGTLFIQFDLDPDSAPSYIHTQKYSKCDLFTAKEQAPRP